jgi:anti-anti-sigma factor
VKPFFRHLEVRQISRGVVVYCVRPRILDNSESQEFGEELRDVLRLFQPQAVVFNLRNVVFLPTAVLSILVTLKVRLEKEGKALALTNVRPEILEVLRIAALDRWFQIFPDEADAVAILLSSAAQSPNS